MELIVERGLVKPSDVACEGWLFVDGDLECFTLEDPPIDWKKQKKIPGKTAIPEGRYEVVITWSPKFQAMVPMLLNVPNFTYIYLHWGNKAADTDGCILVGDVNKKQHDNWVGTSKIAFRRLISKLFDAYSRGDRVWITITNHKPA